MELVVGLGLRVDGREKNTADGIHRERARRPQGVTVLARSYQDLTSSELVEAYAAFCPEHRWQPLPITEVQRQLEGLMLELFGVSKCHGVERGGKGQRGFRGVRFKAEGGLQI